MQRRTLVYRIFSSSLVLTLLGYIPRSLALDFVTRQTLASLPAFLDTLLPAGKAPAATSLGVDRKLIEHASTVHNYPRLLQLGCQWLDTQAKNLSVSSFHELTPQARIDIVSRAESSAEGSLELLFFSRVKSDVFTFYYSHPESWLALGVSAPPQPAGYLDFSQPPRVVQ